MNKVIISVGSNINPEPNVRKAQKELLKYTATLKSSSFKYTKPLLYEDQPPFYNGAFYVSTVLSQIELKHMLLKIESKLGRVRSSNKNGPRTIDLDIVVFNGEITDNDVHEREFLRNSITELIPEFQF